MATKKEQLDAKLGSWTDQASLTRGDAAALPQEAAQGTTQKTSHATADATPKPPPVRSIYTTERGLLDRVNELAAANGLTPNEAIGRLLTWALDQADSGVYTPQ